MLPSWLVAVLLVLGEAWSVRRDARIRFLKLQVELLRHLDHVVQTYVTSYNRLRPHQRVGNRPLGAADEPGSGGWVPPTDQIGLIRRWALLGGLLNHDERKAA